MKDVQVIEQGTALAPANESAAILQVIQRAATDASFDVEKMQRLLDMHERIQNNQAKVEFSSAMAAMQCDIPSIAERGKAHGNIRYATLEDINDVIKPIMQRYGFAISFKVEHQQGGIRVTGILMHRAGHRDTRSMLSSTRFSLPCATGL